MTDYITAEERTDKKSWWTKINECEPLCTFVFIACLSAVYTLIEIIK